MIRSFKSVGVFVLLVCSVLAVVGWPCLSTPGPVADATPGSVADAPRAPATPVDPGPAWTVPDGFWGSAEHGIALVPPTGWTETRRQNRAYLDRVADSPRDGNFCVVRVPNMLGLSMDQVTRENHKAFESMPGLDLLSMDRALMEGREVLRTEYLATHQETGAEYHCLGVAFLHGGDQITLTLTIAADQWAAQSEAVAAAFETLVLEPLSVPAR